MIDKTARGIGVGVLQDVRLGVISPSDFERLWPKETKDLAVMSVGFWLWTLFDDDGVEPIRINANSEEEKVLNNSIDFLSSDHEFQSQKHGTLNKVKTIFTKGVEWAGCELPWHMKWPFPPSSTKK